MKNKLNIILIIFLVGFFVFLPSLGNGFVWDDEEQIVNNTLIHSISNFPVFFSGGAFNSGGTGSLLGIYYKPLMTLSFSILYSLFGSTAFFFHLFSLLIHILSAIIVYLIFEHFFDKSKSLILSLLFLVHPLYSEVVFYAANFQDILFFFLGSLALLLTIYKKNKIFITLLLLFSMLSKETGIIFVIITLFYNSWLPSLISISIYSTMRFYIAKIGLSTHQISAISDLNLFERLLSIPKMAWYYFSNLIFPTNLVPNQHWVVTSFSLSDFWLPLILSILFLTIIIYFTFQKSKSYYFFLALFILSLAMHMQIFPLDVTLSGRWFYLPMFGLLGILGHLKFKKVGYYILTLLILIFSIITFVRSFDWKSGLTLYSHDVKIVKNDFNLENNLGVELYRIGKFNEAKDHFQNSVNLAPLWWTNWNNLGAIYERENDLDKALDYYKKAIDNGNYYLAYENYAKILIKQKKFNEAEEFIKDTLKYFPNNQNLLELYQATRSLRAK
ncbi:MAG: tetratricopeptide repeat protein [Candidatus Woesebacteria bacterium]|nr:tetratricopeptide repeat protein [Candidatus Woesebacteria bacterium]